MQSFNFDLKPVLGTAITQIRLPNRVIFLDKTDKSKSNSICHEYQSTRKCSNGLSCTSLHPPINIKSVKIELPCFQPLKFNGMMNGNSTFFLYNILWICILSEAFNCSNPSILTVMKTVTLEVEKYVHSNAHWTGRINNQIANGLAHISTTLSELAIVGNGLSERQLYDMEYIFHHLLPRISSIITFQNSFAVDTKDLVLSCNQLIENITSIQQQIQLKEQLYHQEILTNIPLYSIELNNEIDTYCQTATDLTKATHHLQTNNIIQLLEVALAKSFRYKSYIPSLHIYGSTANTLCSNSTLSDLDLSLSLRTITNLPVTEAMLQGKKIMYQCESAVRQFTNGQFEVFEVLARARIPMIKLKHKHTNMDVDICLYNDLAVKNTQLLRDYALFDTRARNLMLAVKLWAARRGCNNARNSTFSSYTWVILVIYFLQKGVYPPILPHFAKILLSSSSYVMPALATNHVDNKNGNQQQLHVNAVSNGNSNSVKNSLNKSSVKIVGTENQFSVQLLPLSASSLSQSSAVSSSSSVSSKTHTSAYSTVNTTSPSSQPTTAELFVRFFLFYATTSNTSLQPSLATELNKTFSLFIQPQVASIRQQKQEGFSVTSNKYDDDKEEGEEEEDDDDDENNMMQSSSQQALVKDSTHSIQCNQNNTNNQNYKKSISKSWRSCIEDPLEDNRDLGSVIQFVDGQRFMWAEMRRVLNLLHAFSHNHTNLSLDSTAKAINSSSNICNTSAVQELWQSIVTKNHDAPMFEGVPKQQQAQKQPIQNNQTKSHQQQQQNNVINKQQISPAPVQHNRHNPKQQSHQQNKSQSSVIQNRPLLPPPPPPQYLSTNVSNKSLSSQVKQPQLLPSAPSQLVTSFVPAPTTTKQQRQNQQQNRQQQPLQPKKNPVLPQSEIDSSQPSPPPQSKQHGHTQNQRPPKPQQSSASSLSGPVQGGHLQSQRKPPPPIPPSVATMLQQPIITKQIETYSSQQVSRQPKQQH